MKDLNDFTTGDTLTSADFVIPMSEVQNVVEGTGQTLSAGDLNQLGKGVADYVSNGTFCTDSGAADAYVLTEIGSKQAPTAYTNGMTINFVSGNDNTGASTVNAYGLGVKNIKLSGGADPAAGDISGRTEIIYDAGNGWFEVQENITNNLKVEMKSGRKNAIINGSFAINQRTVAGTVVLSAGEYGHDRFRAGTGGCTYTFTTSENVTTINITAGTLEQEIEGVNIFSGDYTLSWGGTAQGRVNGGSFSASPITATLTGGTNATVELNAGTLSKVQLEKGSYATDFEFKSFLDELSECQGYYRQGKGYHGHYTTGTIGGLGTFLVFSDMRSTPAITLSSISYINASSLVVSVSTAYGFKYTYEGTQGGNRVDFNYTADAEL